MKPIKTAATIKIMMHGMLPRYMQGTGSTYINLGNSQDIPAKESIITPILQLRNSKFTEGKRLFMGSHSLKMTGRISNPGRPL